MPGIALALLVALIAAPETAAAQTTVSAGQQTGDARNRAGEGSRERKPAPAPEPEPWSFFTTLSNGFASNIHFDQEERRAYGGVIAGAVRYEGDDFSVAYELAGHSYTNTTRWNRFSQLIQASIERDLPGNWEFETVGQVGFKGTSEDRDVVDQDFEVSPRLEYQFTAERRLRLFTIHRFKRYNADPDSNAFKNYLGAEFREVTGPRRHWEIGGRFETNDEPPDRGDYRRWTYWLERSLPLTERDALLMQIRYRLKRYTQRFVEAEDQDVLRVDHRWVPSMTWARALSRDLDLRLEYTYETTYSNDPDREYGAHLIWTSIGVRW